MRRRRIRRGRGRNFSWILAVCLFLGAGVLVGKGLLEELFQQFRTPRQLQTIQGTAEDSVTVRYFDMGQGNASLVESEGRYMLIDTGNYEDVDQLQQMLQEAGAERLDYVIGTHPHADHIGSLATIIREYEVGTLLMPDVETDTKTYRVALEAAQKKQLDITHPAVGEVYELGSVRFQILAPNGTDYEELNDYSIALRLICGETDFLWTGDAQGVSEAEMLENGLALEAEVYHAGHHGSSTSSGLDFLREVSPEYAIISCGADNTYGYPHEETLEHLKLVGAQIYTTAHQGTIQVTCRGDQLNWKWEEQS